MKPNMKCINKQYNGQTELYIWLCGNYSNAEYATYYSKEDDDDSTVMGNYFINFFEAVEDYKVRLKRGY